MFVVSFMAFNMCVLMCVCVVFMRWHSIKFMFIFLTNGSGSFLLHLLGAAHWAYACLELMPLAI